jgi:hypothetical protein
LVTVIVLEEVLFPAVSMIFPTNVWVPLERVVVLIVPENAFAPLQVARVLKEPPSIWRYTTRLASLQVPLTAYVAELVAGVM